MIQEQSYFDFIQNNHQNDFPIHQLMYEFVMDSKQDNIQYFLTYFYDMKEVKLDNANKDMLYFMLHPKAHKVRSLGDYRYHNDLFCASLLFGAFEHDKQLLVDVIDYFSHNINGYISSSHFKSKVLDEVMLDSMLKAKGAKKVELLANVKGLFLPSQAQKLLEWAQEAQLNSDKQNVINDNTLKTNHKFKAH
jgi:hypothetical protein